jgi:nucleoside-diphosphate-sugar epimerase
MRVFVTGASGFVGTKVVKELIGAGHAVLGLARSDASAAAVRAAGAEVVRGDIVRPETLKAGAAEADAVIHLAFDHDFSKFAANGENERRAITALGDALAGTSKPLVITSGTGLVDAKGRASTEDDAPRAGDHFPRSPERPAEEAAQRGVRTAIVRLPQVHDTRKAGLVSFVIAIARQKGFVGYLGEGQNHWSAAHVDDVARLYRLVLEKTARDPKADRAARYHAVAEEGVRLRAIADVVGKGLKLPVRSLSQAEAADYFGWMAMLVGEDLLASSAKTRSVLGWTPKGPGLIADLETNDWVSA